MCPPASKTVVSETDDGFRNRKTETFAATTLCVNEGIDAKQMSIDIDQCSAAVAGVDRRVGLDVEHGAVGIGLARKSAHHTKGDGVLETLRTANGEYKLSLPRSTNVGQREIRQIFRFYLDEGEIKIAIAADQPRVENTHWSVGSRPGGALSARTTCTRWAPSRTCALVMMYPFGSRMTPEPRLC